MHTLIAARKQFNHTHVDNRHTHTHFVSYTIQHLHISSDESFTLIGPRKFFLTFFFLARLLRRMRIFIDLLSGIYPNVVHFFWWWSMQCLYSTHTSHKKMAKKTWQAQMLLSSGVHLHTPHSTEYTHRNRVCSFIAVRHTTICCAFYLQLSSTFFLYSFQCWTFTYVCFWKCVFMSHTVVVVLLPSIDHLHVHTDMFRQTPSTHYSHCCWRWSGSFFMKNFIRT